MDKLVLKCLYSYAKELKTKGEDIDAAILNEAIEISKVVEPEDIIKETINKTGYSRKIVSSVIRRATKAKNDKIRIIDISETIKEN